MKIKMKPDDILRLEKLFAEVIRSLKNAEPESGSFTADIVTKFDTKENREIGLLEHTPNGWVEFTAKGTWKEKI